MALVSSYIYMFHVMIVGVAIIKVPIIISKVTPSFDTSLLSVKAFSRNILELIVNLSYTMLPSGI